MRTSATLTVLLFVTLLISACTGGAEEDELVVYSGRSEALVETLVERYEDSTGREVSIRFGSDAQLMAALQEEGQESPADVFWANTAGALAAAAENGLLQPLPDSITNRAAAFGPTNAPWVPITARFRVLAYDTVDVNPSQLPASVMDLPSLQEFEGRIGWTPTYSSFQDFITLMRLEEGPEATRSWLNAMQELNPQSYTSNTPMLRALAEGEIDLALTNHYYVWRMKYGGGEGEYEGHDEGEEEGAAGEGAAAEGGEGEEAPEEGLGNPQLPIDAYHFESRDVGNLALVTGAGLLQTSDQTDAAIDFISYLLSDTAQTYAAESVHEYPVVPSAELPSYLIPIDSAGQMSPQIDYARLRNLEETLELLRDVGVI